MRGLLLLEDRRLQELGYCYAYLSSSALVVDHGPPELYAGVARGKFRCGAHIDDRAAIALGQRAVPEASTLATSGQPAARSRTWGKPPRAALAWPSKLSRREA